MPIPEFELRRVEKLLGEYCEQRVPPNVRHEVMLRFITCGDLVTLYEERPYHLDKARTTRTGIAQFEYDTKLAGWRLYCHARGQWRPFNLVKGVHRFEDLLGEVNADTIGIFWG